MNNVQICHGCLSQFPGDSNLDPPHPYIGAIQSCWQMYSEVLAREFSDPNYFQIHRVTVDGYAAQHIGDQEDRRARQSANLHLIALYLYFEKKLSANLILQFLKKATEIKRDWPSIIQVQQPGWLTIHDVINAKNAEEHVNCVSEWGKSIWNAYSEQHRNIIKAYDDFMK